MSSTPPSPNSPVAPQPPPPTTATLPPQSSPAVAAPPPKPSASPPQPTPTSPPPPDAPPPSSNPLPQPSSPPPSPPPASSPPPPSPPPPTNQSTPVSPIAPVIPPPAPLVPSNSTPPSPTTKPPSPPAKPPQNSPPAPPLRKPPENSPPPPVPAHSRSSPPPPSSSSTTPVPPPPPTSPPSSDLPPPSAVLISPPPPSPASSVVPPGTPNTNSSGNNASKSSQPGGGGGLGTGGTVAIVLVVVLVFVGILGTVACYLRKRKKASGFNGGYIMPPFSRFNGGYVAPAFSGSSQESASALLKLQISTPKDGSASGMGNIYSPRERGGFGNSRSCFTYEEMVKATNRFSSQNLLGEGGFGFVYKGTLTDGRVVAVKQLKIDGRQGEREFRSEVEIISRIHHRHLVSLVGYCINVQERLLVYDYVPNNNLYFHLHGEGRPVLDWATRVKIAVGAARGIAYLHEDCHPRIIHRDIKSSNILLDNNFEARVSDFGLAKLAQDVTHVSTRVVGTFGYMAPEYAASGKLTEKSDIYSFGVVLLELITGRKPVDTSQPSGAESLVEWARPVLSHALERLEFAGLTDPKLGRQYVDSEMFRMIEAAAACVRHSSIRRPKMGQVLRALDTNASTDLTNGMRVGESEMFNPAQQSAEFRLFQRMAFGNQEFTSGFFHQGSWISEGDQVNSRTTN